VIGGPHGTQDLQGRKSLLICGGKGVTVVVFFEKIQVSGSCAYATRHIAKNLVAAGV
jgi:S-adenosylmethionine synthetase